jgi:hypothetical protein
MNRHKSYLPKREHDLIDFLNVYVSGLTANRVTLGVTTGDTASQTSYATGIINSINNASIVQSNKDNVFEAKKNLVKTNLIAVRNYVQYLKTLPGYSDAIGHQMGVIGAAISFDPNTYQTSLAASAVNGGVKVKFQKGLVNAVNIYSRIGTATANTWTLLTTAARSPYIDDRALAESNVPEIRQYKGIGVIADAEIGISSAIVSAVFGG